MLERKRGQSNAAVDMAKYLFALMILALHAGVDLGPFQPVFRIAVPCFFLFSSFYLFSKIGNAADEKEERQILKGFVVRNIKLYAFWLIVQAPLIFSQWETVDMRTILEFLRGLCFGSTFTASWYITATVIDCCLVYFLAKKLGDKILLGIGAVCYLACLMFSNYYGLVSWCLPLRYAFTAFITVFASVVTGFPAGMLWIVIGRMLARRPTVDRKSYGWLFVLGLVGLFLEKAVVDRFGLALRDDQYIMLLPACIALFQILRGSRWTWTHSIKFRNMSTIIYASHGSALQIISFLLPALGADALLLFAAALIFTTLLSILIFTLEKHRKFFWVRCAH